MAEKITPLVRFCRETGYPLRQVRLALFTERTSGIVRSGALIRMGGRWYVHPARFAEYWAVRSREWAERQN